MASRADQVERIGDGPSRMAALLLGGRQIPVMLREVTGAGALAATGERPAVASRTVLRHPIAGSVGAEVVAVERAGVRLRFVANEGSVGFALAIAALGFSEQPRR